MRIKLIVEGKTEKAFIPVLRAFLEPRLAGRMPVLSPNVYHGPVPTGNDLKKRVNELLHGRNAWDHVIALTDVYTGTNPPDFSNATEAKSKMSMWVGMEAKIPSTRGPIRD